VRYELSQQSAHIGSFQYNGSFHLNWISLLLRTKIETNFGLSPDLNLNNHSSASSLT